MSAFWDKVKKNKEEEKKSSKAPVVQDEKKEKEADKKSIIDKVKQVKKSPKKTKKRVLSQQEAKIADRILVNPKISESAMNQQALGKYVFQVSTNATKQEISQAVEAFYGVDVMNFNITNYSKRNRNFRGIKGSIKAFKKAIVTLRNGQSIDVFKENK